MISLLQMLPLRVGAWALLLFVLFSFLVRFVFGSWLGVLLIATAIYYWALTSGAADPYTFSELVLWIDGLDVQLKGAVFTSILTIVGFLVAFRVASMNWKDESAGHLRIAAANEIEQLFDDVHHQMMAMEFFANRLLEVERIIHSEGLDSRKSLFEVTYAMSKVPEFLKARDRLSELSVEVHRIPGKYASVIALVFGGPRLFDEACNAVGEVAKSMWFSFPNLQADDPQLVANFLWHIAPTQTQTFVDCVSQKRPYLLGTSGALRGMLVAPIIGFNFASLLHLFSSQKITIAALNALRSNTRSKEEQSRGR